MNQILESKKKNTSNNNDVIDYKNNSKINKKILMPFKIQIIICIAILLSSLSIYSFHMYKLSKKENISKSLIDSFNITTLYSNGNNYNVLKTSFEDSLNENRIHVIGLLEIDSINLIYPILSDVTEEYLKISPCRFYGPMPNEIGNLCIAGHNYKNYKFFSRLNELNKNDIIKIQDLDSNIVKYSIYEKYDVNSSELNCTNQNTNSKREITLVTCNSLNNSKRLIIKAKETG